MYWNVLLKGFATWLVLILLSWIYVHGKKRFAKSGAQSVPIGMPIVCLNIFVSNLDVDIFYEKLTGWSSLMLWSCGDIVFDQYAVPLFCTFKTFIL